MDEILEALSDAIASASVQQIQLRDRADIAASEAMIAALQVRFDACLHDQTKRMQAISDIGFGRHVEILSAIYLEGCSIREVCDKVDRGERQVRRMRDRALLRVRLPDECGNT